MMWGTEPEKENSADLVSTRGNTYIIDLRSAWCAQMQLTAADAADSACSQYMPRLIASSP